MTEFVHGYQKYRGADFSDTEIKSVAATLAKAHQCGSFRPHLSLADIKDMRMRIKGRHDNIPFLYTHGDFNPGNIIFDSETHEVCGLIDFDIACRRWSSRDIAATINYFVCDTSRDDGKINMQLNPHKLEVFLDAYQQYRVLSKEEMSCLHGMVLKSINREEQILNTWQPSAAVLDPMLRAPASRVMDAWHMGFSEQKDLGKPLPRR